MDLAARRGSVAISGASSSTGHWIARAFAERGFSVDALVPGLRGDYRGRKRRMLDALERCARVHYGLRAEDGGLAGWALLHAPDVWVHHHHWMRDYRAGAYDLPRALRVGVDPLPGLVEALARGGTRGIVHSGSYFEPGEGGQPPDAPATPYAASKREVWRALRACADRAGLPVSKVVMPNAVGPGEAGGRLIPSLVRAARNRRELALRCPDAVSDDLPVTDLARRYCQVAEALLAGRELVARPSGRVQRVRDGARRAGLELLGRRLGLPAPRLLEAESAAATRFANPAAERLPVDWPAFWDLYAGWLAPRVGERRGGWEDPADRGVSI